MYGEGKSCAAQIGKAVCLSLVFILAAVLIFALFIRWLALDSSVIAPVDQAIRYFGILLGCFVCLRGRRRAVKGLAVGAAVAVGSYFLFSAIAGNLSFGWKNLLDLVFSTFAGGVCGAISALFGADR